jgi:hypothetical protein
MAASRHIVEETIDAVLQQQLITSSFRVMDRVQKRALVVPGTKAAFSALKSAIINTIPMDKQSADFNAIVENMAREFGVAKVVFDAKLAGLPRNDPSVDARLQLVMLLSVLREHWQNNAYEAVIAEVREMALKRGCNATTTSRDALNKVLSSQFGLEFSHLVNLYVVREWGQLTGKLVKIKSARLTILNSLVASVVKIMLKDESGTSASDIKMRAPLPPPGPHKPGLPRPPPPGLPPPPPVPPVPR